MLRARDLRRGSGRSYRKYKDNTGHYIQKSSPNATVASRQMMYNYEDAMIWKDWLVKNKYVHEGDPESPVIQYEHLTYKDTSFYLQVIPAGTPIQNYIDLINQRFSTVEQTLHIPSNLCYTIRVFFYKPLYIMPMTEYPTSVEGFMANQVRNAYVIKIPGVGFKWAMTIIGETDLEEEPLYQRNFLIEEVRWDTPTVKEVGCMAPLEDGFVGQDLQATDYIVYQFNYTEARAVFPSKELPLKSKH